jgi:small subunit ribosomal protein S16
MRMGKKKQPTYRVVAADSRKARNGSFLEVVGFYNPRSEPSVIEIDNDKAVGWLRNGAQPTERVEKLLKISGAWDVFKGRPAEAAAVEDVPVEEAPAEEAPAEIVEETVVAGSDAEGAAGDGAEEEE